LTQDLLSCSLSRVRTQLFVSAAAEEVGLEVRTAGDRTRRRRLNKLSCADWLPHDRGFVSGLPRSKDERRSGDRLITGQEGSPPRPCRRQCAPADLLLSTSLRCRRRIWSALERGLGDAGDRPDKADHLTGDCSSDHNLRLARRSQPPIARAQPDLPFPSDVADRRRQLLVAVMKLAADACRHAIEPAPAKAGVQAPSISTRRASTLPALVMPPRRTLAPEKCSEGTRPR